MNTNEMYRFAGFTLDRRHRCLRAGDHPIELRPRSFDVLACLVERAGRLVSKDELIEAVWPNVVVTDESLTRCICDVRRALGDSEQEIIKTLPRRGYLLAERVEPDPDGLLSDGPPLPADPIGVAVSRETAGDSTAANNSWRPTKFWRRWCIPIGTLILALTLISGAWWLLQPVASSVAEYPSVAVLPLLNLSDDPGLDHFSDGIAEDITLGLTKFGTLSVIARSSAFRFREAAVDARHIGQDLGARYLLQGSIRRDSERLRIIVQLVDADSGRQLWAEHYDREPGGSFVVQDELTQRIVTTLVTRIGDEPANR